MATISNPNKPTSSPGPTLNSLIDVASGTVTYICEADPGALTSEAVWRIQRVTVAGSVTTIQFAGRGQFDQVADNRASLSY